VAISAAVDTYARNQNIPIGVKHVNGIVVENWRWREARNSCVGRRMKRPSRGLPIENSTERFGTVRAEARIGVLCGQSA